jgi:hypothetical protein
MKQKAVQASDWGRTKGALGAGENRDRKRDGRTLEQKQADLNRALAEAKTVLKDTTKDSDDVKKILPSIRSRYRMAALDLIVDSDSGAKQIVHVKGMINPEGETDKEEKKEHKEDKEEWVAKEVAGDPRKFSHYVLVPNHPTRKDRIFLGTLGFRPNSAEDAQELVATYIAQAKERFARKEYTVGVNDQYGQRFTITIVVKGKALLTGWILDGSGTLKLATPFSGFAD